MCWFTFVTILFMLYSVFRYILQRDDFFLAKFLLHIDWLLFSLSIVLAVIYWSHLLTKEVSIVHFEMIFLTLMKLTL